MRNANGSIDWNRTEEQARGMAIPELLGAIADIRDTLSIVDALDRADGGDRGGYYRDEASVYHAEIGRRPGR